MLVISRKVGERVRIRVPTSDGPVDIWVKVCDPRGHQPIRLGIEAPADALVLREELIEQRESEP